LWFLVEFNSFSPAVGRLGSDSSRGGKVEAGGLSPPSLPHFNYWLHSAAVLLSPTVRMFAILETFILLSISLLQCIMYVHHLDIYCILFRRFLISKINVALQLTKLWLKKVITTTTTIEVTDLRPNSSTSICCGFVLDLLIVDLLWELVDLLRTCCGFFVDTTVRQIHNKSRF